MDNYVLNAIVNHANCFYKTKSKKYNILNEDDLLREIILKEVKKNKRQTRYNILSNYLSNTSKVNKFKNKQSVVIAIKNINNEMEAANKEFRNLFQACDIVR